MENLDGKCVVLGVTGGIAAYKMANVASALRKAGADVHVIMTENATQFITPLTFETLTNNGERMIFSRWLVTCNSSFSIKKEVTMYW